MTSSRRARARARARARSERKAAISHSNSLTLGNILLQPLPPPLVVETESTRVNLVEAQWVLGYRFRNPRLLEEALTHSSDPAHESYQRLEFVRDAVLSLAFTNYFYLNNPHLGRGELSALCSANVSNEKLARAEVRHGLYRFVRRNAEELDFKVFRSILVPITTLEAMKEQCRSTLHKKCRKHGTFVQFKSSIKMKKNIMKVFVNGNGNIAGISSSKQKRIAKLNATRDMLQQHPSSDESDNAKNQRSCVSQRQKESFCERGMFMCMLPKSLRLSFNVKGGSPWPNVTKAQWAVGYNFCDPRLLEEALTHSSYLAHASYQRLEFLGNATLSLAFTNYFYLNNPDIDPGELMFLRGTNMSKEKLARAAVRLRLYRFVRHNNEELDHTVQEFSRAITTKGHIEIDRMSYEGNTKKAPRVLADIMKSVAAAIYIDSGLNLEIVWKVFRSILAPIITRETMKVQPRTAQHSKSQKQIESTKFNRSVKRTKNTMKVFIDGDLISISSSKQKLS
ncbi:endoribonuclease Dicer homolog 3a-like [Asparagus officinalis]|uniref:endoribonuclease Dicer homolog 3a-like n=1 Tax=Asparagus officinalis TaxID=4686 RepID=UPI00098E4DB2|nr:endoribonuclease Dicer homolog 3a-like [Asparagus officinalis]